MGAKGRVCIESIGRDGASRRKMAAIWQERENRSRKSYPTSRRRDRERESMMARSKHLLPRPDAAD